MQKQCDTPFQLQLNFDFESTSCVPLSPPVSNVVHGNFREKTLATGKKSEEDLAILELVLLNARKLKW